MFLGNSFVAVEKSPKPVATSIFIEIGRTLVSSIHWVRQGCGPTARFPARKGNWGRARMGFQAWLGQREKTGSGPKYRRGEVGSRAEDDRRGVRPKACRVSRGREICCSNSTAIRIRLCTGNRGRALLFPDAAAFALPFVGAVFDQTFARTRVEFARFAVETDGCDFRGQVARDSFENSL